MYSKATTTKRGSRQQHGQEDDTITLNMSLTEDGIQIDSSPDVLGEVLVNHGLITRHQLFNALNESYRKSCSLKDALWTLGYIDEHILSQVVLRKTNSD